MIHPTIKPYHLERNTYVYVRQSSPGQVRRNREGQQRQRAMVDHIAALGWPRAQIVGGSLCEKHPDARVQRAIQKVLDDFERFPSARQLYLHLDANTFQLPVVPHGCDWRDVEWVTPSYGQILAMVVHPVYAGNYVRGRRKRITTLDAQGHKQTKEHRVPREDWKVFLPNHHEPYIPQEAWERNMAKRQRSFYQDFAQPSAIPRPNRRPRPARRPATMRRFGIEDACLRRALGRLPSELAG